MAKFKYGDSGRGYGPPSGTGVARDRPLSTVLRPAPAGRKKKKKRLPTFRTTAEHFYGDVQRCSGQYMNGYSDIQKKELL